MIEYVTENWVALGVIVLAGITLFERIALLTPTTSDNKVVEYLYKVAAILGFKVEDNKGDAE